MLCVFADMKFMLLITSYSIIVQVTGGIYLFSVYCIFFFNIIQGFDLEKLVPKQIYCKGNFLKSFLFIDLVLLIGKQKYYFSHFFLVTYYR